VDLLGSFGQHPYRSNRSCRLREIAMIVGHRHHLSCPPQVDADQAGREFQGRFPSVDKAVAKACQFQVVARDTMTLVLAGMDRHNVATNPRSLRHPWVVSEGAQRMGAPTQRMGAPFYDAGIHFPRDYARPACIPFRRNGVSVRQHPSASTRNGVSNAAEKRLAFKLVFLTPD
jgi:hypothetical protein